MIPLFLCLMIYHGTICFSAAHMDTSGDGVQSPQHTHLAHTWVQRIGGCTHLPYDHQAIKTLEERMVSALSTHTDDEARTAYEALAIMANSVPARVAADPAVLPQLYTLSLWAQSQSPYSTKAGSHYHYVLKLVAEFAQSTFTQDVLQALAQFIHQQRQQVTPPMLDTFNIAWAHIIGDYKANPRLEKWKPPYLISTLKAALEQHTLTASLDDLSLSTS